MTEPLRPEELAQIHQSLSMSPTLTAPDARRLYDEVVRLRDAARGPIPAPDLGHRTYDQLLDTLERAHDLSEPLPPPVVWELLRRCPPPEG